MGGAGGFQEEIRADRFVREFVSERKRDKSGKGETEHMGYNKNPLDFWGERRPSTRGSSSDYSQITQFSKGDTLDVAALKKVAGIAGKKGRQGGRNAEKQKESTY